MPSVRSDEKRIRKNISDKNAQNKKIRTKRNVWLAVICTIFSIVVILGAAYIILHCISDKEELRDEGIEAMKNGKYEIAISMFLQSMDEEQWFSDKMDIDTELYLASTYMRCNDYVSAYEIYDKYLSDNRSLSYVKEENITELSYIAHALDDIRNGRIQKSHIDTLLTELEKGNKSVSIYIGTCYQSLDDPENMLKYYNIYVDAYGMNSYIAYQISSYYLSKNDIENARTYLDKGYDCSDDMFYDRLLYNDICISEIQHDYEGALEQASRLIESYPENETYKKEYDFLYSRVNVDPTPVHTKDED